MRTLYLDCGMGAAGDMLTAALLELIPDKEAFLTELNSLGIPDVTFSSEVSAKCGIQGTHITVTVHGEEESEEMHAHGHAHSHGHEHEHPHTHGQAHRLEHSHSHEYTHEPGLEHSHEPTHEPGHSHTHEQAHEPGLEHSHEHTHELEHSHTHEHTHEPGHEHSHGHSHDGGHPHHHSSMHEIGHIIGALPVSEKVKSDILAVYSLIAEAESHAHGVPVTEIHFHEVGTMDAVADVTAVCMLMERLAPEQVVVSPVHVGSGHVKCAHGILPVPAPATAYILRDVPIYGGQIQSELCTPTGAALLKHFATKFGNMPVMRTAAIGYGMGKKDFTAANCVRALMGETENSGDTIAELCCNLDDMTAEAIAFAQEQLFAAGALDVYTVAAQMKKSRHGTLLSVMCREEDKETMISLIFRHTSTIGIREAVSRRYTLSRTVQTVPTELGEVRKKVSAGYGVTKEKYEYEDIAHIARERQMSLADVTDYVRRQDRQPDHRRP